MRVLRYALRTFAGRDRSFVIFAVLTLAIAAAAFNVLFSLTDGALFRGLPYPSWSRLAVISQTRLEGGGVWDIPVDRYFLWSQSSRTFDGLAALIAGGDLIVYGGQEPSRIRTAAVEYRLLSLLGTVPVEGNLFHGRSDSQDALISWGLWQSRFGGRSGLIGGLIETEAGQLRIVGILPDGFLFPGFPQPQLLRPLRLEANQGLSVQVIGRLREGVGLAQAKDDLSSLQTDSPREREDLTLQLQILQEHLSASTRTASMMLMGSAVFFALIACVNTANLSLARLRRRERSLAVRAALGAGRWQLFKPVLVESCFLSLLGAAIGFGASLGLLQAVLSWIPVRFQLFGPASTFRMAAVCLSISLILGGLVALLSSFPLRRSELTAALSVSGGRTASPRAKWHQALLVSQVAIAMLLLTGAGLFVNSLSHLLRVETGISIDQILSVKQSLPRSRYPDDRVRHAHFDSVEEALRSLPGVRAVGSSDVEVLGQRMQVVEFRSREDQEVQQVAFRHINREFLEAAGLALVQGSLPDEFERRNDVLLVNQAAARRYWPTQDAVGQELILETGPLRKVVGVVRDSRLLAIKAAPQPEFLLPFPEDGRNISRTRKFVVKTRVDPEQVMPLVRQRLLALDDRVPVVMMPLRAQVDNQTQDDRLWAFTLSGLAAMALGLASLGCFGLVAYSIEQRRQEFGIRMSLGASRLSVLIAALGHGLRPIALGTAIGLLGGLALSGYLSSLLFEVRATDPASFAATAVVLLAATSGACLLPAAKAARLDPAAVLRDE